MPDAGRPLRTVVAANPERRPERWSSSSSLAYPCWGKCHPLRKDGHFPGENWCRNSPAGLDAPCHRPGKTASGRRPVQSRFYRPAILVERPDVPSPRPLPFCTPVTLGPRTRTHRVLARQLLPCQLGVDFSSRYSPSVSQNLGDAGNGDRPRLWLYLVGCFSGR
jgi:hypothetical protein